MLYHVVYEVGKFIKERTYELAAGLTGFISTIVIDWKFIAERAVETIVVATVNGFTATVVGFATVYLLKKIVKKNLQK